MQVNKIPREGTGNIGQGRVGISITDTVVCGFGVFLAKEVKQRNLGRPVSACTAKYCD